MDFGGIIAFGGLCLVCVTLIAANVYAKVKQAPRQTRKRLLLALLGCILLILVSGRFLYKVYVLDEGLWGAALSGNLAEVKSLLDAGANPNDVFEGDNAMDAAVQSGNKEMVDLIRRAGGKESKPNPIDQQSGEKVEPQTQPAKAKGGWRPFGKVN